MPTITITGDTTQDGLEQVLCNGIGKYGEEFNVRISNNLRFENQNKEIKELKAKNDYLVKQVEKLNIINDFCNKKTLEPLKNKRFELREKSIFGERDVTDRIIAEGYKEQDIKSAVEWLKEEYKQRYVDSFDPLEKDKEIIKLINKAFEDVILKEEY